MSEMESHRVRHASSWSTLDCMHHVHYKMVANKDTINYCRKDVWGSYIIIIMSTCLWILVATWTMGVHRKCNNYLKSCPMHVRVLTDSHKYSTDIGCYSLCKYYGQVTPIPSADTLRLDKCFWLSISGGYYHVKFTDLSLLNMCFSMVYV